MGDVVHTMPVIADILQAYPKAQIDWVVEEAYVDLVKQVHGVHRVIPVALRRWRRASWWRDLCTTVTSALKTRCTERRNRSVHGVHDGEAEFRSACSVGCVGASSRSLWGELRLFWQAVRAEKYDWVIDAQGLLKSALIAQCARGPLSGLANRTEGASFEWPVRFFYKKRVYIQPRTHVIPRARLLVAQTLGYAVSEMPLIFGLQAVVGNITPFASNKYVVFVHAASRADKGWPISDWIALGQRLILAGYAIVLPWGASAEGKVSEHLSQTLGSSHTWVPPHLSMGAITSLMAQAAAIVGLDTGLAHIATALDKPVVQLHRRDTAWRAGSLASMKGINLGDTNHLPTWQEVETALIQLGVLGATTAIDSD